MHQNFKLCQKDFSSWILLSCNVVPQELVLSRDPPNASICLILECSMFLPGETAQFSLAGSWPTSVSCASYSHLLLYHSLTTHLLPLTITPDHVALNPKFTLQPLPPPTDFYCYPGSCKKISVSKEDIEALQESKPGITGVLWFMVLLQYYYVSIPLNAKQNCAIHVRNPCGRVWSIKYVFSD